MATILASIVLFTFGLFLAVTEWQVSNRRNEQVDRYLQKVLVAPQEPRRSNADLGATALLLADANLLGEQDLPLELLNGSVGDILRGLANAGIAGSAQSVIFRPCGAESLVWALDATRSTSLAREVGLSPWSTYGLDDLVLRPVEARGDPVLVARSALDSIAGIDGFAQGPATCWHPPSPAPNTQVFLPPLHPGAGPDADGLVGAANEISQLAPLAERVVAVFFVSAGGGLAFRTTHPDGAQQLWREPWRRFDAAGYMEFFLKRPRFVNEGRVRRSPLYVDWYGSGLVSTYCIPSYSGSATNRSTRFAGIYCVDLQAEWTKSVEEGGAGLDAHPLFDITELCVAEGRLEQPARVTVAESCSSGIGAKGLNAEDRERAMAATRMPFARGEASPRTSSGWSSASTALTVRRYPDDSATVLLLRPIVTRPRALVLGSSFVAFVGAVVLALVATRQAEKLREQSTTLEVFRSLPVGVIEVDGDGRIVMANERAEEILGIPMRTFGGSEDAIQQVTALLDPNVFRLRAGLQEREADPPQIRRGQLTGELTLRRSLVASQYIARLRKGDRVLLMYGAPLVELPRRHGSFAVLEAVTAEDEDLIKEAVDRVNKGELS